MQEKFQNMLHGYLNEGEEDYIGLWEIMSDLDSLVGIRNSQKISSSENEALLQAVLAFVTLMLQNGFEIVTLEKGGGYTAWPDQDSTDVSEKISSAWKSMSGPGIPDIGFGVWFNKVNKQGLQRH